ncbi:hypothetical protein K438DRAFT_1755274 [Mycena galopus ATCC 62051]|nr:hypothetical protein K438DRAFT_1755274 [Mycena galopus ATCC 62051]
MSSDDESLAELHRRQHEIAETIAGYKAKITDSKRELADCLERLQQFPRVYPILTLPNEITSEIFVNCLPLPHWECLTPSPFDVPMLLLQVCRAWRAIATATPGLFCEVGKRWAALDRRHRSSYLEVLELSTDINYYYPVHRPHFPLLRKLALLHHSWPQGRGQDPPSAKSHPDIQRGPTALRAYLESRCAFPSRHFLADVDTPSLVKCFLVDAHKSPGTAKITHANLKSFDFNALMSMPSGKSIFPFLTFPTLGNLNVTWTEMNDRHLLQFVSRSSSSLLKLWAREIPMESLSAMVAFTDLSLHILSGDFLEDFFSLFDRRQNPKFLPQLQVLDMRDCSPFVNMPLINALSSRRAVTQRGAAQLRHFRQFWTYITYDELQVNHKERIGLHLTELAKGGLEIYVGCWKPSLN